MLPNSLKTIILLASLIGVFLVLGQWPGGTSGMLFAFVGALLVNGGVYWFSDRLALRRARAHEVTAADAPALHALVAELAASARLPMPRIYLIESDAANAFATGRDLRHGAIAVTSGILRLLDRDELATIIAHELSHIKNRDLLISMIAATIVGAIRILAHIMHCSLLFGALDGRGVAASDTATLGGTLLLSVLAPLAAMIIQSAVARTREFNADAAGARIAGDAIAAATTLRKVERWNERRPHHLDPRITQLSSVNPLRWPALVGLFRSRPLTKQRIARLEYLALGQ